MITSPLMSLSSEADSGTGSTLAAEGQVAPA